MRNANVIRKTKETEVNIELNLDGKGNSEIKTGIGFFDHMLESFAKHSLIDLKIVTTGDLYVDNHHTVEDVGIVLGEAICLSLGRKEAVVRYDSIVMPMDDALVLTALDLSGRGYFEMDYRFANEKVGEFETDMVNEFFRAVALNGKLNLHFQVIRGFNCHHIIEAMFKGFARTFRQSIVIDKRINGILSSKDLL